MGEISTYLSQYFDWFYIPHLKWTDVIEIIVIAYLIYHILLWFKNSRAWTLLRGILLIALFIGLAAVFQLNTILWLAKNIVSVGIVAVIILFQPELRRAFEELGRKKIFKNFLKLDSKSTEGNNLTDKTIYEIVKTSTILSKAKTGALIVFEHETPLGEYESTGIEIDAVVTSQLLVNIFEKNTPLHDGAVIVRDNRVVAATCYLPLTDRNDVNKELGTRHRAGLGISEVTDSLTLIVSEETGSVSIALKGVIYRNLDEDGLRKHLEEFQDKPKETKRIIWLRKGESKDE